MTIWIDDSTKLRVNIHAPYKGFSRLDTPEIRTAANVAETPAPTAPTPPDGFSLEESYYRTEQLDAPYVVWTLKSQEQLDEITASKAKQLANQKAKAENAENTTIQYLTTHTATQIAQYVNTNVTDLASAKVVLARLAIAVGALLR